MGVILYEAQAKCKNKKKIDVFFTNAMQFLSEVINAEMCLWHVLHTEIKF